MSQILLVTGGSRGIGAAVCRSAAKEGYSVAVNFHRDLISANNVVDDITNDGGIAFTIQADVSLEADIIRMFDEVTERLGVPSGLVNSAGVGGKHMLVSDFEKVELDQLMQVNVIGTMLCCREASRRMSTKFG